MQNTSLQSVKGLVEDTEHNSIWTFSSPLCGQLVHTYTYGMKHCTTEAPHNQTEAERIQVV